MAKPVTKLIAVALLILAALIAPIALPVRMFIERARRRTVPVEQIAPRREQGLAHLP